MEWEEYISKLGHKEARHNKVEGETSEVGIILVANFSPWAILGVFLQKKIHHFEFFEGLFRPILMG